MTGNRPSVIFLLEPFGRTHELVLHRWCHAKSPAHCSRPLLPSRFSISTPPKPATVNSHPSFHPHRKPPRNLAPDRHPSPDRRTMRGFAENRVFDSCDKSSFFARYYFVVMYLRNVEQTFYDLYLRVRKKYRVCGSLLSLHYFIK